MQSGNKLSNETSPYLLQHAHNPVQWYPWGEEALTRAKNEDKPILISIGYSSCHWCHVMERESFEDEATAALMNDHFINIKIDREERPDLDHIYMDAVQAMTGSGGWPLNVFLTPEAKPFYGGTYFPPVRAFNRSSWKEVLIAIAHSFKEKRIEINQQADYLTKHLSESNTLNASKLNLSIPVFEKFSREQVDLIFDNLMKSADPQWGGFGDAPKFPQTFSIQFLLRYYYFTRKQSALDQALLSLDKMIDGGIYDQLAGGFARYSTDREWLAPHFEKMLYDNALLISVLSEAYQITRKELYAKTIRTTVQFLETDMMDKIECCFYSAMDADSEGEEGKYYVWEKSEIDSILGEDAIIFCRFYDVSENGNWEGRNILRVLMPPDLFAKKEGMQPAQLESLLNSCRERLLQVRRKRVKPLLDDKIILGWNALMNIACSEAYAALGDPHFKDLALKNMQFIFNRMKTRDEEFGFYHTYKNGQAKHPAFLDDYALLAKALIHLQEITGRQEFLLQSKSIIEFVKDQFEEEGTGYFFYTQGNQQDVIVRKKEVYDGATPAGNSIMAWNLQYLSLVFDVIDWRKQAAEITDSMSEVIIKYPNSFGIWAMLLAEFFWGTNELAIVGGQYEALLSEVLPHFIPQKILQSYPLDNEDFPLLTKRFHQGKTFMYWCKDYSCEMPVENLNDLLQLIDRELTR